MNAKGRAARRVPDADCPGEWPCAPRWAHCRTGQWGRGYRALHPAQGILRCLRSQTTMCFLFPRTLDQAIPGSRSQHWRGITQRAGNGSHKRRASISCPPFLRGNWVVGGSLPAPSKCYGVVRKVVVVVARASWQISFRLGFWYLPGLFSDCWIRELSLWRRSLARRGGGAGRRRNRMLG